jgi:hypothetical protein
MYLIRQETKETVLNSLEGALLCADDDPGAFGQSMIELLEKAQTLMKEDTFESK